MPAPTESTKMTAKRTDMPNITEIFSVAVSLVLSVGAGIYLSFALVYLLEPLVGIVGSYAIVGAVFLLLIAIVILFKKKLILVPITRFISKVLLDNEKTPL